MIAAFGEFARRWAASAAATEPVIAVDENRVLEALAESVRRRLNGETFALALLLDEESNRFVRQWGAIALAGAQTLDHRLSVCAGLEARKLMVGPKTQVEASALPTDDFALGRALWTFADVGVAINETTYARLARTFDHWHVRRIRIEQRDPFVPTPGGPRDGADHLVVWAFGLDLAEIPVIVCALEQFHIPVYIVGAKGEHPAGVHRCTVEQAEPLLRSAAAIVDVRTDGPATAHALAVYGVPLATTRSSGAYETLEGVSIFDAWNRASIVAAILEAMGGSAPRVLVPATMPSEAPPRAELRENAPRVSIVIATYNRRSLLPFALDSVARQTYPAIETIVVNDAGDVVDDIAERFGARVLNRKENGGHGAALSDGLTLTSGKYVGFLDDDDILFPDHVEHLVGALERTGDSVAHANSLIVLHGANDRIIGFSPGAAVSVDVDQALVACPFLGMNAMLMRRDVFEEVGKFDASVAPNHDYEMIVRLLLNSDLVHVAHTTCLYRYTSTVANQSVKVGRRYAEVYEATYRLHPFPDRPLLAKHRRAFVEQIRSAGGVRLAIVGSRLACPVSR